MKEGSAFRKKYLDSLKEYKWKHSMWDTPIVEKYFQKLIDINDPSVLTLAVATTLYVCTLILVIV